MTQTAARAEFAITGQRITWMCAACGQPILDRSGYLEADNTLASKQTREFEQFEKEHSDEQGRHGFTLSELLDMPDDVPWLALHRNCDPCPDDSGYWIDVDRIDTLRKLIHWAGHLAGKDWIDSTDWSELLLRVGQYA